MRFLFKLASFLALIVAILAASVDAIQSVAASEPTLTSLQAGWSTLSPASFQATAQTLEQSLPSFLYDTVFAWILSQPAFAVFAMIALLFWVFGYQGRSRSRGLALS